MWARPSSLKSSGEALLEFGGRELVVLRPERLDLDRAHQGGDPPRGLPVQTMQETVNEVPAR